MGDGELFGLGPLPWFFLTFSSGDVSTLLFSSSVLSFYFLISPDARHESGVPADTYMVDFGVAVYLR